MIWEDFLHLNHGWQLFYAGLIGACVGSVLNMLCYRLPKMIEQQWREDCACLLKLPNPEKIRLNLWFPRSHCPGCHRIIHWWANIPILSFLILRGRCAHCHARIGLRYLFLELLCTVLTLAAYLQFGPGHSLFFSLGFIYLMLAMMVIDIEHLFLPDSLSLGLLWLGLLANRLDTVTNLDDAVLAAVIAYLGLWLFLTLYALIRGKEGMGRGDVKLFAALGAWFGVQSLGSIILLASVLGIVLGLIVLSITKQGRDTPLPFGPALGMAGLVHLFYGKAVFF